MCDLVVVVFRDFEKASLDIITNYFLLTYIATCNVLFSVLCIVCKATIYIGIGAKNWGRRKSPP